MWYSYCALVTIAFALIKLVNYGLHHMYDTTECVHEEVEDEWQGPKRYQTLYIYIKYYVYILFWYE